MTPEQLEVRFNAIEADVTAIKSRVKNNSTELGANSRASLTFLGATILMIILGSRFSADTGYSYQIELDKLAGLLGLPAIAALLAAVIPGLRK